MPENDDQILALMPDKLRLPLNPEAEAEIERLRQYLEHRLLPPAVFLRAAMRWAFDYSARHCEEQIHVWSGTNVDPGIALDMASRNLRALTGNGQ